MRGWFYFVLFAAACLAGAELGQLLVEPSAPASIPALWPPAAILVAALVTNPPRRSVPFFVVAWSAVVLSMVLHGRDLIPSLALATALAVDACVAGLIVHRTIDGPFALDRLPHALALVIGAAVGPLWGAVLVANTLGNGNSESLLSVARGWWLAETISILCITPVIVAIMTTGRESLRSLRSWKALEVALVVGAGIFIAEGVFGGRLDPLVRVPAYVLPFLLWPVFRFGVGGTSVATSILSFIVLWHAARGEGPLLLLSTGSIVLRTQGASVIAGASLLLLSSTVAERKRIARERDDLVAQLQRALAEIKTLRGFIPICAWCHRIRDDAGFWQELEAYFDARTDATFSHSICPKCIDAEHREIETTAAVHR